VNAGSDALVQMIDERRRQVQSSETDISGH